MERRPVSLKENTIFPLSRELYQVLARKGLKFGILVLAMLIWVDCYPPLGLSFLLVQNRRLCQRASSGLSKQGIVRDVQGLDLDEVSELG